MSRRVTPPKRVSSVTWGPPPPCKQALILTQVPGKPISANRGKIFIQRLDSVPESVINLNLGINYVLNLTHLSRSINSLIRGKLF